MSDAENILRNLIADIAIEQGFREYDIKIKPITSGGANFTSVLFVITVSGDKDDLKLFAKVAVMGEKMRDSSPMKVFDTERFFYTTLTQIYKEVEDQNDVPEEHRLVFPKYYGNNPKYLEETIVLEDLVDQGYTDYDRFKSMNWAYASKAVAEVAKFHALSHAFARDRSEEFAEALEVLKYSFEIKGDQKKLFFEKNAKTAIAATKDENREKLAKFLANMDPNDFLKYIAPIKAPVIIHADYRTSNHMYKVNKDGSVDIKIIDFQTMQGGSPVVDLLYLVFSGTDEAFRREYYEKLMDHYYEHLCAALRRLNIEPNEVYSRDDFDQELSEKLYFGLILAVFVLPLITVEAEHAPVIDENADMSSFSVENTSSEFTERLNGVVNDFVRWGII